MSRPTRNTKNFKNSGDFSGAQKRRKTAQNGPKSAKPRPETAPEPRERPVSPRNRGGSDRKAENKGWIWGTHAVTAALANPRRTPTELRFSPRAGERLDSALTQNKPSLTLNETPPADLDKFLPDGAAHQGLALKTSTLPSTPAEQIAAQGEGIILVLDQVTDPQNVGAMFRLASAFNLRGIIMQDRNAPPLSGATAKVAVGALETVPFALVTNVGNTLNMLKEKGWMVTGLAGEATVSLSQAFTLPKNATAKANVIVMGAEGPGLRPRVRDCCDQLAKINMPGGAESLNVSTAAAIAIYEAARE